ncbi:hypothetical protein CPB84DRAFT_1548512 [Gymnopilus junonius]|uniref:F-box domain-containing protein n=1 Tax=Gymnopilus junonius TaxID=109634 RepID=A0A9P5TKL4_GYMJU|nr:hypothetical protein CPB84DRAFT_1548512 [Gymnopilus junonius]
MQLHLASLLQNNDPPSTAAQVEVKDLMSRPLQKLEIFYYCLPDHRNPVMSFKEAPMLLAIICRSWRSIVLSSPRIWARLHVQLLFYNSHPSSYPVNYWQPLRPEDDSAQKRETEEKHRRTMLGRRQLADIWLCRSGTCPLSISLSFLGDPNYPLHTNDLGRENDVVSIFDSLVSVSSRLADLELVMPFEMYQILESKISADSLPLLRRLRLCFPSSLVSPNLNAPKKDVMLLQAPGLQSLSILADSVYFWNPGPSHRPGSI